MVRCRRTRPSAAEMMPSTRGLVWCCWRMNLQHLRGMFQKNSPEIEHDRAGDRGRAREGERERERTHSRSEKNMVRWICNAFRTAFCSCQVVNLYRCCPSRRDFRWVWVLMACHLHLVKVMSSCCQSIQCIQFIPHLARWGSLDFNKGATRSLPPSFLPSFFPSFFPSFLPSFLPSFTPPALLLRPSCATLVFCQLVVTVGTKDVTASASASGALYPELYRELQISLDIHGPEPTPDRSSDRMSGWMPRRMPEKTPHRISERMPNRMSG